MRRGKRGEGDGEWWGGFMVCGGGGWGEWLGKRGEDYSVAL